MSLSHKITRLYGAKGWAAIFAFMRRRAGGVRRC